MSLNEAISPVEQQQMSLRANAIGCLYIATRDDCAHGGIFARLRLRNTIAMVARVLTAQEINDTINTARKEEQWPGSR